MLADVVVGGDARHRRCLGRAGADRSLGREGFIRFRARLLDRHHQGMVGRSIGSDAIIERCGIGFLNVGIGWGGRRCRGLANQKVSLASDDRIVRGILPCSSVEFADADFPVILIDKVGRFKVAFHDPLDGAELIRERGRAFQVRQAIETDLKRRRHDRHDEECQRRRGEQLHKREAASRSGLTMGCQ